MLLPNFCCTSLFRASFLNRIVFLRNGLPSSIPDISSVSSFKHNLFSHNLSKLNSDFNVNRTRSWKTFCCKCRSYNINYCSLCFNVSSVFYVCVCACVFVVIVRLVFIWNFVSCRPRPQLFIICCKVNK